MQGTLLIKRSRDPGARSRAPLARVLGRAREFFRKLQSPTGHLAPTIAWQLVDALYLEDARILHGAALLLFAAALAYMRTGSPWLLVWGAASLPLASWRIGLARAYRQQHHVGSPDEWARRSMIGAWLAGALWGAASIVLVVETDPFVQFLLIVCQTAFIQGGAVRNSSVPVVANGQTLFASIPLLVAALANPDPYYKLFSLFVLFHVQTVRLIVRVVHGQMLAYLVVNDKLDNLVVTDGLTLLLNRRGFDNRLLQEWHRCRRDRTPLSLMIADVDHFKQFNDGNGHQAGDECLQRVGQAILDGTHRKTDIVARYGGEEFAIILPNTDAAGAAHVAERMRARVEASGSVTISIGGTTARPESGIPISELIRIADGALYRAKRDGRNRVVLEPPETARAEKGSAKEADADQD